MEPHRPYGGLRTWFMFMSFVARGMVTHPLRRPSDEDFGLRYYWWCLMIEASYTAEKLHGNETK